MLRRAKYLRELRSSDKRMVEVSTPSILIVPDVKDESTARKSDMIKLLFPDLEVRQFGMLQKGLI